MSGIIIAGVLPRRCGVVSALGESVILGSSVSPVISLTSLCVSPSIVLLGVGIPDTLLLSPVPLLTLMFGNSRNVCLAPDLVLDLVLEATESSSPCSPSLPRGLPCLSARFLFLIG